MEKRKRFVFLVCERQSLFKDTVDFLIRNMAMREPAGLAGNLKICGVHLLCMIGLTRMYGMQMLSLAMITITYMICIIWQDLRFLRCAWLLLLMIILEILLIYIVLSIRRYG